MHEYIIFISNFLIVFWLILQMITYKSNCCKPSYMESFKKCTLVKKKLKKENSANSERYIPSLIILFQDYGNCAYQSIVQVYRGTPEQVGVQWSTADLSHKVENSVGSLVCCNFYGTLQLSHP